MNDPNKNLIVDPRFDIIESLLDHNLTHIVEDIFEMIGFRSTWYELLDSDPYFFHQVQNFKGYRSNLQ